MDTIDDIAEKSIDYGCAKHSPHDLTVLQSGMAWAFDPDALGGMVTGAGSTFDYLRGYHGDQLGPNGAVTYVLLGTTDAVHAAEFALSTYREGLPIGVSRSLLQSRKAAELHMTAEGQAVPDHGFQNHSYKKVCILRSVGTSRLPIATALLRSQKWTTDPVVLGISEVRTSANQIAITGNGGVSRW